MKSFKAGDVLVPEPDSAWATLWSEAKLITSHRQNNVTYWWVHLTDKNGMTHFDTLNYGTLSAQWSKKVVFYRLGKKYRFKNGNTRDVYEILELHQVDRAISADHEQAAMAKCHDSHSGKVYLVMLNKSDFDYMQEV